MKRKLLLLFTMIFALVGIVAGAVACRTDDPVEKPTPGPEKGEYYCTVGDAEYTLSLSDECKVTLVIGGETLTGSYVPNGGVLTITIGEQNYSAAYADDVITMTYNNVALRFLRKVNYTVTFDTEGGSAVAPLSVLNGKKATEPQEVPILANKVFVGWYTDKEHKNLYNFNRPITSDLTLYARFVDAVEGEEYTVTFVSGEGATQIAAKQTVGGVLYAAPSPEKEGAEFVGWWVSHYGEASKLTYQYNEQKLSADTTFYAVWKSDAPVVSVEEDNITWSASGTLNNYTVVITGPAGSELFRRTSDETSLTKSDFDFSAQEAGDYIVSVSLGEHTTNAYFLNKALAKPSALRVSESTFLFNPVDNATSYTLSMTCGTLGHSHTAIDLGDKTSYDFSACEMPEGGFTFTVTAMKEGWISATSDKFIFDRTLGAVEDLTVNAQDVATWSPVEHATSYYVTVLLGTEEVWKGYVYDTNFPLGNYGAGKYTLKVLPVARGWTSPAEAEFGYEKARLSTPSDLKLVNETLSWTAVKGANGYKVFIGDEEFETEQTSFELTSHLKDGVSEYSVSVSACGQNAAAESLPCESLKIHKVTAENFPKTLKYSAGVLSWEPALGVEEYVVTVGEETYNVAGQSFDVEFTAAGDTEITLVAKFADGTLSDAQSIDVHVYRLAFDAQFGDPVDTVYLAKGDPVPAAVTERYGYTFAGWYDDPTGAVKGGIKFDDPLYSDDNDLTLYANWLANKYKVTLNEGSQGEALDDPFVEFESQYTLPVPVSKTEEMAFAGWYSQPNGAGTQYTDKDGVAFRPWTDEERSLYAYWVELFTFSEVEGGYAVSKGVGIGVVEEITIPQTHLGKPVVAISDFSSTATLKVVNFYDTINTITVGSVGIAFEGCNNLESINVLKAEGNHDPRFFSVDGILLTNNETTGDVEIYYYPVHHKLVDETFYVPDVVTRLTAGFLPVDNGTFTLESNHKEWTVSKVIVPASVTHVSADAFYYNNFLREVTFLDPEDGEGKELTFENGAFRRVHALLTVNLPARLSASFSGSVFDFTEEGSYGIARLTSLTVPENAKYFTMIDGLLCRKTDGNGRELVLYPLPYKNPDATGNISTSEIVIPEGVTSIPSDAIPLDIPAGSSTYGIKGIKKVEIARTVTNIAAGAFDANAHGKSNGLENVTELIFHSTADDPDLTIGQRAFYRFFNANLKISVGTADGELSAEDKLIYVLPENLVNLGSYAFGSYNTNFKTAVVNCGSNNRTLNFAVNAFASDEGTTHTSNITTVKLGQYVHGVNIAAVFGSKVTSVEVDENNDEIKSVSGVLFNSEMTEILFYPAGVDSFVVPDTVTKIGDNLFGGRTTLTDISLPATLTYIGSGAFSGCTKLKTVTFREELEADSAGKGLEKATSLTIGDSAFYNCSELTAIKLPECTLSIGAGCFSGSGKLKDVTLNEGLKTIGDKAFESTSITTIQLPASLGELVVSGLSSGTAGATVNYEAMQVFSKCKSLTEIKVAEGNEHYSAIDGVLYGLEDGIPTSLIFCPCGKEGTVTVPASVKVIRSYAFGGTSVSPSNVTELKFENEVDELVLEPYAIGYAKITDLKLPEGTTEIGRYALGTTTTLTSVFIPKTVTKIGFNAFNGCSKLQTVTFEEGGDAELMIEGGYDTSSTLSPTRGNSLFSSAAPITKLELPDRIKHIDDFVFSALVQLTSITIPASVETIGVGAFYGCTALAELIFPENSALREIDYLGFYNLTALTSLKLPASLRTIGRQAFSYSTKAGNLTSLTLNEGLETIGLGAFMGLRVSELYIPASVKRIEGSAFGYGSALSSVSAWQPLINLTTINFADNSQIEYIGKSAFAFNSNSTSQPNLTKLTTVNFGNPVGPFEIGENVFENCIALESITLPASLKTIAASAFISCTSLTTVNFAEGTTKLESVGTNAFQNTAITEITFPESENGIELGQTLFNKNAEPVTYHLSASVKSINNSFAGCTIKTITVDENNPYFSIDKEQPILYDADGSIIMVFGTIEGALVIDLGAFEIGASAFTNQTGITSVYIPASVVTIHKSAFEGCTALTTVTIQSSSALESIAGKAFAGCTNLASINLEATSHLTHLGASAFQNCSNLTSVDLSRNENLQILGTNLGISSGSGAAGYLFQNDTKLETVKLPNSITTLGTSGFENTGIKSLDLSQMTDLTRIGGGLEIAIDWDSSAVNTFKNCKSLTRVVLPASVGAIGANAFEGCSALESINIDNVAVFGQYAFSGCGLTSLTLPVIEVTGYSSTSTSYTNMGMNVFEKNTKLTQLTIPEGVNALYRNAFSGCTSLQEVTFPESFRMSDVVTGSNAYSGYSALFSGCTSLETVTFKAAEIEAIPSSMFSGCSKLATVNLNDVHAIEDSAFNGTALTEFTIGPNVDTVDVNAFAYTENLKTVTVMSANVTFGNTAFQNSGLSTINFPEDTSGITFKDNVFDGCKFTSFKVPNAKAIGKYFLANNTELTEVTFATEFSLATLPAHFFDGCTLLSKIELPQSVTGLDSYALANTGLVTYQVPKQITTLNEGALANNTKLTTVTFAADSAIEKFGTKVFCQDKVLKNVTLPDSLKDTGSNCFQHCEALESIKLPKNLTTLGSYAFSYCTKLSNVDFNGNTVIKGFAARAFEHCEGLESITLPASLEYTGQYTFQYSGLKSADLSACTNMKYLGSTSATSAPTSSSGHVFYTCKELTNVSLPDKLTHIAAQCFDGCAKLENINLPDTVTFVGTNAFNGCEKLDWKGGVLYSASAKVAITSDNAKIKAAGGTVTMPQSVTIITANTFKGMTELKNIVFSDSLTYIGESAFSSCSNLESADIPANVTYIGKYAFQKCTSLKSVDLSKTSMKYIGEGAADTSKAPTATSTFGYTFDGCTKLAEVKLPSTATHIAAYVFQNCTSLKSIELPESIILIGQYAFKGSGLEHFEFPKELATLGGNVLNGCTSLKMVYIPSTIKVGHTTSAFASSVFTGCKNFTIYTDGKADDLKKNWTALASQTIVGDTSLDQYKAMLSASSGAEGV